ncbi:protein DpdD [Azospirillum isscasi]|uniref:Protein DpdD n=1 Tax=Azospirillum isscasi TaxID=3053926 RepID=A0ABU0WDC3_9PROT|nr:protein DpdD [Azospirillum isscasi]MDQ2102185.1 protein DpdD [Azospirillum isscasi]
MISDLDPVNAIWLRAFFSPPNELDWDSLVDRTAPQAMLDQVLPWLRSLREERAQTAVILPFVQNGSTVAWYATACKPGGGPDLEADLTAWLGPSYLAYPPAMADDANDPAAAAMRRRFGSTVYRFSGTDQAANARIAKRIAAYAALTGRRPVTTRSALRPVGAIRADFERALLVKDGPRAEALVAEMRDTGRLNEENLRYLDVRLKAGLGFWPQIARDHWLVRTLADLPVPPQTLSDIIEALYRTYLEDIELAGDAASLLPAFEQRIAKAYPRLLASRRGIKTPQVVKAFLLFERCQPRPSAGVLAELLELLPQDDPAFPLFSGLATGAGTPVDAEADATAAEEAFDDGNFDRAFALFLSLPMDRRSVQRLVSCALLIGTDEARTRLLGKIDSAAPTLLQGLAEPVREKLQTLRATKGNGGSTSGHTRVTGWVAWAEALRDGQDTHALTSVLEEAATWDVTAFGRDEVLSRHFATLLGNLSGEAALAARRAVPAIYNAFFPQGQGGSDHNKAVLSLLFDLVVLDEALSGIDLELLSMLLGHLLAIGISSKEYQSLLRDLEDVQERVSSYAHLAWGLDVCEMLVIAPAPSADAREARLRFFLGLVGQAKSFAHRLKLQDTLPLEFLCRDFGVDPGSLETMRLVGDREAERPAQDLAGKTIVIYTLAEAAGTRAKQALEKMFPGASVQMNSDTVATARLTSLAKAADIFVFAWRSSSHQAFYCIKDAMAGRAPVMAAGKGTASILRAVLDNLT